MVTTPIKLSKLRTVFDIVRDILEVAKTEQVKTRIMYSCNLSYKELNKYLDFLLKVGLLERRSPEYKTTMKGLSYLKSYKELTSLFFLWVKTNE